MSCLVEITAIIIQNLRLEKLHYSFPLLHLNVQNPEILIPVFYFVLDQTLKSNKEKLINCDMALEYDTCRAMLLTACWQDSGLTQTGIELKRMWLTY